MDIKPALALYILGRAVDSSIIFANQEDIDIKVVERNTLSITFKVSTKNDGTKPLTVSGVTGGPRFFTISLKEHLA